MTARRSAALVIAVVALACAWSIAGAGANVSHVGWPHRDAEWFASNTGQVGVGTNGGDLLLGGAGSDTIYGGLGDDVLWGDRHPSPNGPDQRDVMDAGPGNDWIYASHGENIINAGPGDDRVIIEFGHGTVDCGPGYDIVFDSHHTEHAYTLRNCEAVQRFSG